MSASTSRRPTFARLRWALYAMLAACTSAAFAVGGAAWAQLVLCLTAVGLGVATNLLVAPERLETAGIGALLLLDVGVLGVVLALTGGPSNPLCFLFFIHVAVAATVTPPPWAWAVWGTSVLAYGALFSVHWPLPALATHGDAHSSSYAFHLQGMWLAFAASSAVVTHFTSRTAAALAEARAVRTRTSRLLGLTTLAAGAAHEIGNPLGTIALVARDLRADLDAGRTAQAGEDVDVILEQVQRARRVLDRMAVGAGELTGEPLSEVPIAALLDAACRELDPSDQRRVERRSEGRTDEERCVLPREATAQVLLQLLRNGLEAAPGCAVELTARALPGRVLLSVLDRGPGLDADTSARIGEPFFTTRPEGTGLGVFLARTLVEQLGGELRFAPRSGGGLEATLDLPRRVV